MSDNHDFPSHDAHAAPVHSASRKPTTLVVLVGVTLLISAGLVGCDKGQSSGQAASVMTEEAITARIQKVGNLTMGEAKHELKTGEEVFKAQCTTCHSAGLVGAPKFGDAAAWAPRIKTGFAALLNSALKGKGNMTPQGGGAFSDYEVSRALVYMANAGGAKFEEPPAPAAAASAPAPEASAAK